jgi:hypothetical protein
LSVGEGQRVGCYDYWMVDPASIDREQASEELTCCPWCDAQVRRGALVCRGCHADIAYGVTWREIKRSAAFGLIMGVGADFLVIWTTRVADRYSENVLYGLFFGLPLGATLIFPVLSWLRRRGRPRFFRRRSL